MLKNKEVIFMEAANLLSFAYQKSIINNKVDKKINNSENNLISDKFINKLKKNSSEKELNFHTSNISIDTYCSIEGIKIDSCNSEYALGFDKVSVSFREDINNGENVLQNYVLERMTSKYETFRNNIFKNYSKENLEKQLKQLDDAYDKITNLNIAFPIEEKLWQAQNKKYIKVILDKLMITYEEEIGKNFDNLSFSKMSYKDKNIFFNKILYDKVFTMSSNIMKLAEKAKQYIKDGNLPPVTKEEKNNFNKYISDGTDGTIGNLSYYDIKAILSVVGSIQKFNLKWLNNTENYNTILNSFNSFVFSDEIKNLLSNVLSQTRWNSY